MEEVDLVLSSSYISVFKVSWSEPRVKTNSYLHSYNNNIYYSLTKSSYYSCTGCIIVVNTRLKWSNFFVV